MRKYGTPEPVSRVPDEHEAETDPQGINVTAAREEALPYEISNAEIIHEGEDQE